MSIRSLLLLSLAAGATLLACGDDVPPPKMPEPTLTSAAPATPPPAQEKDLVETALAAGKFNTLAAALKAAGLVDTLKGAGPYTVFAPTDDAFGKLPKEQLDALMKDKDKLTALLTYHVVAGKVTAAEVAKMTSAKTVNGKDLVVKTDGSAVMVNDAKVTSADITASNGVIHVVDTVLVPEEKKAEAAKPDLVETAAKAGNFTTLAKVLGEAGLVDTLKGPGPYTVFAPSDEAFAKVPKATLDGLLKDKDKLGNVLKYHVVEGKVMASDVAKMMAAKTLQGGEIKVKTDAKGAVTLDGKVKVVKADLEAGNGVIHVIDAVLMPPPAKAPAKAAPAKPAKK